MDSHAEFLPRYLRLREVGRSVASALVKRLPKDVLDEGGTRLGILRGGVLVFDSEDEMAVLMDFCIHDIRRHGRNAVEAYLEEAPYPPDSDEMIFLQGLKDAYYSLFLIEAAEPGIGVQVRDAARGGTTFIMDVGFGRSAVPGLILATRILSPENFAMTTGAGLPLGPIPEQGRAAWLKQFADIWKVDALGPPSKEQASNMAATIIKASLQKGAASSVVYEDPVPGPGPGRAARPARPVAPRDRPALVNPTGRIGRNDPCPCGSGRKFKKCCGAHR
jgi:hypothetical protein